MQEAGADETRDGIITNTQESWRLHSLATAAREYHLLLPIPVHSGTENVCQEANTAQLGILEDKFKCFHQCQESWGHTDHGAIKRQGTAPSKVRTGILLIFKELLRCQEKHQLILQEEKKLNEIKR